MKKQQRFNAVFIDTYLQRSYNEYNTQLAPEALLKIKKYYCLGIPYSCFCYAKIYGQDLTTKEQELATLTGIITPLIDDFTDYKTLSNDEIDKLTSKSLSFVSQNLEEDIVKEILDRLVTDVNNPEGFLMSLQKTIQAQHQSQKQMDASLSYDELLTISREKGGRSHVFFHYVLDQNPSQATVDTLFQMGAALQMCNDIFDVYKDNQEGIYTFANTCTDFVVLEKYYIEECRKFCSMARALPYRSKDLEFFITAMASIMGRGIVALRMLQQLQKGIGGGVLPIDKLERKQLICDMEKPLNMLKAVWFTYQIVKR